LYDSCARPESAQVQKTKEKVVARIIECGFGVVLSLPTLPVQGRGEE
jgi:hypothetical protein